MSVIFVAMKKYFAKWLPVEEKLLQGDKAQYRTGEIIDYLVELNTDNLKKVKLFICTREIQVDDNVINVFGYASLGLTGVYVSDSALDDTCYILTKHGDEQCVKSHWVKVIGEISSYASWVKEGDEFSEDEIKIEIERVGKKAKYIEIGDSVMVSYNSPFFYIEGVVKDIVPEQVDCWEWNDKFIIANARKQIGIDELGYVYENIEDFETTRAMVSYPDKKITVVRVTCSQCKTFH